MTILTSQLDALAAAREGVVAVDRPDLATVGLRGADVLRYLHAVCTQDTAGLRPGDAAEALLLSPKGRIEFAFRLAVLDGGVLLDTDADAAPALAERLARFVFRYDVTVAEPTRGAVVITARNWPDGTPMRLWYGGKPELPDTITSTTGDLSYALRGSAGSGRPGYLLWSKSGNWKLTVSRAGRPLGTLVFCVSAITGSSQGCS